MGLLIFYSIWLGTYARVWFGLAPQFSIVFKACTQGSWPDISPVGDLTLLGNRYTRSCRSFHSLGNTRDQNEYV